MNKEAELFYINHYMEGDFLNDLTQDQIVELMDIYADHTHKKRVEAITDEMIEKYVDEQPYYGACTHEYKEGIEQGATWLKQKLLKP